MSIKRKIFDWSHIDQKLSESEIKELKQLYKTYHKKMRVTNGNIKN